MKVNYYISELNISIFKNYPKSPKMNAEVERLNRTTQEEFYLRYKSLLWDNIEDFNQKLVKWFFLEVPYNLGWACTRGCNKNKIILY